jgi:hypothetical protein
MLGAVIVTFFLQYSVQKCIFFKKNIVSFALNKHFHWLTVLIYQLIAMATNNSIPFCYIMYVMLIIGIIAIWGILKSPE